MTQKYKSKDPPENIRGIKYTDADISAEINDKNDEGISYGGVEVPRAMAEALKLNLKQNIYCAIM